MMKIKVGILFCAWISFSAIAKPMHGVAIMGEPALAKNFSHFSYVNPDAPKGGTLHLADYSGFDSLNPFIINGIAPSGISLTHDSLMKNNAEEPFALYGLIAKTIDISDDKKHVVFTINENARFNDNSKITSEDVAFSFKLLREKGTPVYRSYFQEVVDVKTPNSYTVEFFIDPKSNNRELPLMLGQLPVLSKVYWQDKDFTKTTLDIPVSSGPYLIETIEPNRSITYKFNDNYWAKDLNVNRGFYNFDRIKYDTYRDSTVAVEALRSGMIDWRLENEAKKWVKSESWDLVKSGQIQAESFEHHLPNGMQGFVFNLRKPLFQDRRVRKALSLVLDFDWINTNLFHGLYDRLESFFDNSEFRAPDVPSDAEKALLKPHLKDLSPEVLEPRKSKQLSTRDALRQAMDLLEDAGWRVTDGVLQKDGQPFEFEILLDAVSAPTWERVVLPYIGQLKRLGINASIKTLDILSYKTRLDNFDYDMIITVWGQSLSPGTEQAEYWGSKAADTQGSYNYSGIKNAAIDALIDKIVKANDRPVLVAAVRALDRVLLSEYIVVPHWSSRKNRCLYWNTLAHPEHVPLSGVDVLTWWKK